ICVPSGVFSNSHSLKPTLHGGAFSVTTRSRPFSTSTWSSSTTFDLWRSVHFLGSSHLGPFLSTSFFRSSGGSSFGPSGSARWREHPFQVPIAAQLTRASRIFRGMAFPPESWSFVLRFAPAPIHRHLHVCPARFFVRSARENRCSNPPSRSA